ncbi:MAG: bifunctional phosphoribosylaminoimidazolecarboxamide formyltransferase/IMP cyclohydrolase, partial [Chloroflexi bacterium]|nr:bifunctional phosphoribosylaminoimidazolecarboxamide formyltransferase/IMP cyclohydrolase [Chloroflexota bacterium]
MRGILSVSDKTGLIDFAKGLQSLGVEMFSTGGTHKALLQGDVSVKSISDLTGFPEIMDGRVKTLHPAVHGGILARRNNKRDLEELSKHKIGLIDLVAVNLYPFVQTVSKPNVTMDDALENIDIGGPTMVRASAKNFPFVAIVVDPADYSRVLEWLKAGGPTLEQRRELALKAFQHTALYDTAIAAYLRGPATEGRGFPRELTIGLRKLHDLRYGENPHQQAAFYQEGRGGGIAGAAQLHGKEMSYNNFLDADAAWSAATDFSGTTAVVVKHTNPCGLASHSDLAEAYRRAFSGDPVSAFGGIVAFNRTVTAAVAQEMAKVFYEIVIAPHYAPDALELLKRKKDLRILRVGGPPLVEGRFTYRHVSGGMLVQTPDAIKEDPASWKTVTKRAPTAEERRELAFAWKAAKHVKSNAIVLVKDSVLVGMGAGQPNRVNSVHLALKAAGDKAKGSVLASDAFFPFPDGVELAASGGVAAVA